MVLKEINMMPDPRLAVVDDVYDVEKDKQPFGKRWLQETVVLSVEKLSFWRWMYRKNT